MASLKTVLYLGICVSAWIITTADTSNVPRAENVRWMSLDFKTILIWTTTAADHPYTVRYSEEDRDWIESPDCIRIAESACDLTNSLEAFDRTHTAKIQTEPVTEDYDYSPEELPYTYSLPFNPYRESNISAVNFTVEAVDEGRVIVNITDPLTSIHRREKQLSIRDILKKDLQYKIIYHKSGSTGERDFFSESSVADVPNLDEGESYCFMVAAFIPSRPKTAQLGAWSKQLCTQRDINLLQDLSLGAWVGVVFSMLTVLIIVVTVTVLCCRQSNKSLHTSQSSAPI